MPTGTKNSGSHSQSHSATNKTPTNYDIIAGRPGYQDRLALAFTAAIVAFVGAIIVLTIPYVVLSAPLPSSVDPLGLSIESTQRLFFGRVWYLLIPSVLFALWAGYKFYQWSHNATPAPIDEKDQ